MTLRPLACLLALTLLAGAASPEANAQKKNAATDAREKPATACEDFYSATNLGWLDANPLPVGKNSISALEQLTDSTRQQQIDLLNGAMQAPEGNIQILLGDFWASGLNVPGVDRDGANPIAPLLERVNAIRRDKSLPPAIAALHQIGIPVMFNFGADVDLKQFDRHIGYFSQGGLGLPDPAYYSATGEDATKLMGQYNGYVQKILALTGTQPDDLAEQAQWVIDIETRMAAASKPLQALRDPRQNYAPVSAAELDATYPHLLLGEFLKTQEVTATDVSIANPALFAELDTMVDTLKPKQWQAYLRWRIGDSMAPYLAQPWRDASFDFRGRVLAGQTEPASREQHVLDAINLAAGPMLGREYAAKYLPADTRTRAEDISGKVRDALGAALERDPRLGTQAKAEAKAKLDSLTIEIGTPARDLDFTVQPMGRGSFGGNMLIASTWRHREEMRRIGEANAARRWDVLPQHPALAYDIAQNRLIVTAAMLQSPVLAISRENSWQYGSFGALVGHELSHGFDARGRLVDAQGQLRDWWGQEETGAWQALGNRVVAQYGAYPYPDLENVMLNGSQTRDENIADIAGVELAWNAFSAIQPEADEASRKAFFEGWASLWPQHTTTEVATRRAASNVHAPGKWRTNGPLVNQAGFAKANDCTAKNAMHAKADEQIVLWPSSPTAE